MPYVQTNIRNRIFVVEVALINGKGTCQQSSCGLKIMLVNVKYFFLLLSETWIFFCENSGFLLRHLEKLNINIEINCFLYKLGKTSF